MKIKKGSLLRFWSLGRMYPVVLMETFYPNLAAYPDIVLSFMKESPTMHNLHVADQIKISYKGHQWRYFVNSSDMRFIQGKAAQLRIELCHASFKMNASSTNRVIKIEHIAAG